MYGLPLANDVAAIEKKSITPVLRFYCHCDSGSNGTRSRCVRHTVDIPIAVIWSFRNYGKGKRGEP
jgi:hypothetical protein